MKLIVVESPAKAQTIKKFLGKDFIIEATFGHIRDLPKKDLGVDIKNNFAPTYVVLSGRKKIISQIKKIGKIADEIYLACDFDREGEAIAWHVIEACGFGKENKKVKRITFIEITKEAILKALKNPRGIDFDLVDSQQARRILDRLVGYKLSPFLWKKIKRGLSAGRVQSVTVRLIVAREKEIENFIPEEFWGIEAEFEKNNQKFSAKLIKKGKEKIKIKNQKEAEKYKKELLLKNFFVKDIQEREEKIKTLPPFNTATLQQEAFLRLGFSSKKTMFLAQQLYEGIDLGKGKREGLITYMRTDSFHISQLALNATRKFIKEYFGEKYLPKTPRFYKTKTLKAQEAHEAIRPTFPQKTPESFKKQLSEDQYKLYDLIWRRLLASQMNEALFKIKDIEIEASSYIFATQSKELIFDGFLKIYPLKIEEKSLPPLLVSEKLKLLQILTYQRFTKPPSRYTEATLIKALEEKGIGRPSTYVPIISTIQQRGYVAREGRYFRPLEIGIIVNNLLVEHFPEIVDVGFTAEMEENLDKIAEGKINFKKVLEEFYNPFSKTLESKYELVERINLTKKTKETCPQCKAFLVQKQGRYGSFLACENFPKCKFTKNIDKNIGVDCPLCGSSIIEKRTKKGKIFYGCLNYPNCKWASWDMPTDFFCRECGGIMTKKGKILKCSRCGKREILKEEI